MNADVPNLRLVAAPAEAVPGAPDTVDRISTIVSLLFLAGQGVDSIQSAAESPYVRERAAMTSAVLEAALRELRDLASSGSRNSAS